MSGGGGSVSEVTGAPAQMATALSAGLDVVDLDQTVKFTQYRRVVLPADGFVFWVKADLLSPSALLNTTLINRSTPNQPPTLVQVAPTFEAQGSLHHTSINKQDPDEGYAVNRLIFTSKDEVNNLNDIAPDTLYLASLGNLRYCFSSRSMWYKQAHLYHYSGDAVYPTLATQIIDDPAQLNLTDLVISNSLPIWLGLNNLFPIYPALLVPDNIRPPYAAVSIGEQDTSPLQSGAIRDAHGSRWQLAKDTVRVVTYGVRNNLIMDWMDFVNDYTLNNPGIMGVMNSPMVRDGLKGQTEISARAQMKVIMFEVSYYQSRVRDLALQLIKNAFLDYFLLGDEGTQIPVVG